MYKNSQEMLEQILATDPKMKDVWESMEDAFEDAIKNEKADIKAILDKAVKEIKEQS